MKQNYFTLLLAAAGLLAGIQTVKAQKVVLHMAGNQKAEYSTQQLDSITFVDVDSPDVDPSTDPSITGNAIDISNKSATLIGYATSIRENLANDLRVGFIYCLEGTPSKNNGTQITVNKNDVAEDGRYTATIENLLSNATYYFRSFVYQSGLWFYGKVKSFITEGIDVNFTTGDATAITCFSAKVSGSVNVKSSYSTLEYGICYGTGIEPTIDKNKVVAASENFTLQLRQLTGGTDYYYRPYIIVDGQTCYGTVRTFRTLDDNVVETGDIDKETLTVTSHLTIGSGAYSSLVLGVCSGRTEQPTINDETVTSDEVDDENNYTVTLVSPGYGTIYYRAYILIDGVPHYGAVKYFEVLGPNPKVRVAFYETIPGYDVQDIKFYTDATTDTAQTNCTLFAIKGDDTLILDFGPLNGNPIGSSTSYATFTGSAANYYYLVLPPNESGTNLNLRVDYTLTAPVTGETIKVKGATAQVPSIYTTWKPGFAYTYIFKISYNTNGWTSDPASLYPITFDAVEVVAEDGLAEYITTIKPTITTFGVNSTTGKYVVGGSDYAAGSDIYAAFMENSAVITPTASNYKVYTVTTSDATNFPITYASVAEALGESPTGTAKITCTAYTTNVSIVTKVPGEDGLDIAINAVKMQSVAAGTYAIEYTASAAWTGTYTKVYKVITVTAAP